MKSFSTENKLMNAKLKLENGFAATCVYRYLDTEICITVWNSDNQFFDRMVNGILIASNRQTAHNRYAYAVLRWCKQKTSQRSIDQPTNQPTEQTHSIHSEPTFNYLNRWTDKWSHTHTNMHASWINCKQMVLCANLSFNFIEIHKNTANK